MPFAVFVKLTFAQFGGTGNGIGVFYGNIGAVIADIIREVQNFAVGILLRQNGAAGAFIGVFNITINGIQQLIGITGQFLQGDIVEFYGVVIGTVGIEQPLCRNSGLIGHAAEIFLDFLCNAVVGALGNGKDNAAVINAFFFYGNNFDALDRMTV